MNKYTFVVVAHQTDYEALCLQAFSMALYLPPSLVEQIIIIENPKLENHDKLRHLYGGLAERVIFMAGPAIANRDTFRQGGWFAQQILKLLIAHYVKTPRYVCLDAKNTLVFPLRRKFLESWYRPRTFRVDYTEHSSLRWLRNTFHYFGLEEHNYAKAFVPTITPFTLITTRVKELIEYVKAHDGTSFSDAFLNNQLTEFFLYAGYLISRNQLWYDFKQPECHTVWDVLHSDNYVHDIIRQTERKKLPLFSVHRRAVPMLSEHTKQAILAFYKRRGLDAINII